MKKVIVKILIYLFVEMRDWIFAIGGFVAVILIPTLFSNWWLAIPVLMIFVILYLFALFYSSRLLEEE